MRIALVCVASVFLAGCSLLDRKETTLEVTAQILPISFRAGYQATVTITTTNAGIRPQRISADVCPMSFVVLDASGKQVGPPSQICSLVATGKTLEPGESFVQIFPWGGYGLAGNGDEAVKLAAGTYLIRGTWDDDRVENHTATFQILN